MLALDGDDSLVVLAAMLGLDQQAEPTTRQQGGEITLRIGIRLGHAAHEQARFRTAARSEEHTSELQSLMRISYAVFCLKKKKQEITRTIKDDKSTKKTKKN